MSTPDNDVRVPTASIFAATKEAKSKGRGRGEEV